ncbi:MAG: GIY-YIG nuclease family protein, partial [Gemmatimonadales bacterium]
MTNEDAAEARESLREQAERLPGDPGVYLFKDVAGKVLYVGKAKALRTRVRNYFREGADGRYHIQFLVRNATAVDFMVTETEQEALILENNLIKKFRPRYNVFLKDDKTYVNLRLNTSHPFPRLTVVRRPRRDGARYFGPFASAGSVRQTLRTLGRVFPMRTCTDAEFARRTRPCLYYHIKRCPAPCVGKIDAQDYAETIRRVTMFLKGRGNELLKTLRDRMDLESAERRYEAAARTRDQIFAVQRVLEKQRITS